MSDAAVTVRRGGPGDAAGVAAVLNGVIHDGRYSLLDTPFGVAEERDFLAALPPHGFVHVAEAEGGIVGFQTVESWSTFATHECDHVATMGTYVHESWRRRGVATRLAAASFVAARTLGFEKVFTDLRADNPSSLAYHLSLGFAVVGAARRQARVDGRDVDVLFVERFL